MIKRIAHTLLVAGLVVYSGWLTGDRIFKAGYNAGAQVGYQQGAKEGFKEGKREACMIKPI